MGKVTWLIFQSSSPLADILAFDDESVFQHLIFLIIERLVVCSRNMWRRNVTLKCRNAILTRPCELPHVATLRVAMVEVSTSCDTRRSAPWPCRMSHDAPRRFRHVARKNLQFRGGVIFYPAFLVNIFAGGSSY